jgi:hypothetical protein
LISQASIFRDARWDDTSANPVPFDVSYLLLSTVQSFGGELIYGWQFINKEDSGFSDWKNRLSLDLRIESGSLENRLILFQEGATSTRHLDMWIWFGGILIRDASGNTIDQTDFFAGGKCWCCEMRDALKFLKFTANGRYSFHFCVL